MAAMTILDEQTVRNIEKLASQLEMSPEEVVRLAVMETTKRRSDDKRDRLARVDERSIAISEGTYNPILPEIDDLIYDDDGLPQ